MSVSPSGSVFWLAPAYFVSSCSVDISKFPFDTQTCEIVISTWMFSTSTIKLNNVYDVIDIERLEQNGEYDIIQTYARIDIDPYFSFTLEYLVFGIELRRKYSYYLINIVLPVFFMQLLGLVVFAVPTDSGEKLSFALTLLLSLTVMMTLVAEKIPTTSLQIPTLSLYMLGGTIISSLELIMTVYILHLKHYRKDKDKMSRNMKTIANFLAFLVCMKRNKISSKTESLSKSAKNSHLVVVEEVTKEDITEKTPSESKDEDNIEQCPYTYEDLAVMMDRFSIILFGFLSFTFTFVMLFMIL
ncbi:neuronal acetylcholine receptor subunit alpha-2-like [Ruditapes philippinarum]|uniref:neuronal acetylcholine receptor subunit alpha-2-like n=1 Tax=Ruditapes philippinarum TaxID=129788 RepID=UPI00295AEEA0|nr:neuronal acetylcholine receptor subunit alpha-2-like [Ruditapes philippinarum]